MPWLHCLGPFYCIHSSLIDDCLLYPKSRVDMYFQSWSLISLQRFPRTLATFHLSWECVKHQISRLCRNCNSFWERWCYKMHHITNITFHCRNHLWTTCSIKDLLLIKGTAYTKFDSRTKKSLQWGAVLISWCARVAFLQFGAPSTNIDIVWKTTFASIWLHASQ